MSAGKEVHLHHCDKGFWRKTQSHHRKKRPGNQCSG